MALESLLEIHSLEICYALTQKEVKRDDQSAITARHLYHHGFLAESSVFLVVYYRGCHADAECCKECEREVASAKIPNGAKINKI